MSPYKVYWVRLRVLHPCAVFALPTTGTPSGVGEPDLEIASFPVLCCSEDSILRTPDDIEFTLSKTIIAKSLTQASDLLTYTAATFVRSIRLIKSNRLICSFRFVLIWWRSCYSLGYYTILSSCIWRKCTCLRNFPTQVTLLTDIERCFIFEARGCTGQLALFCPVDKISDQGTHGGGSGLLITVPLITDYSGRGKPSNSKYFFYHKRNVKICNAYFSYTVCILFFLRPQKFGWKSFSLRLAILRRYL